MTTPSIVDVDRLDCRMTSHDWAFDQVRAADIDRHFADRRSEKPALYDGRVLLARRVEIVAQEKARVLEVDAFETRFSRFLAWRDFGFPDVAIANFFSMPAVRSSDGAFLIGEMGRGHSSAGALYFPGGTPDLSDVGADGQVDLAGSLARELLEETGLDVAGGQPRRGWSVVFDRRYVACMKIIDWPAPASELLAKSRAFLDAERDPELAGVHMLSRPEQLVDPRLPAFMVAFLTRAFAAEAGGG